MSIKEFGAFVQIAPDTDGLCHISEISDKYLNRVEDLLQMGDIVRVKVILVDVQGRIKLSRKAAMLEEGNSDPEPAAREGGDQGGEGAPQGDFGGDRGGDRGGRGGDRGGRGGRR